MTEENNIGAIERLKKYVEEDKIYQEWANKNMSYVSDFDRFCIEHCKDIETLIKTLEKTKEEILNETTSFCEECPSKDVCPEDECLVFRIEQIVEK